MTSRSCLLLMVLSSTLNGDVAQSVPPGFKYTSYEVIIPRKLAPRYGQQDPHGISYLLAFEGKGHMVHLRQKKGFVPKEFPIFTYSKEGKLQVDYPFIRDDCFYHGFVQGKSSSLVTLSTCSGGLRGLLQLENKTYEIEPVQASATFQHVVYRLEEKEGAVLMGCGLTEEEEKQQEAMMKKTGNTVAKRESRREWWSHTRHVKVAVVVDHERYVRFGRNETVVAMQILDIFHTAQSFFEPLSVHLSIAGLEIWTRGNLIDESDHMESTLRAFSDWRRIVLLKRLQNDAGHLFIYKSYELTLGIAFLGQICSNYYGTGVTSYMTSNLFDVTVTFAHELGHNLGMMHDEKYCSCDRSACIMRAFHSRTDKFSNCSYNAYFNKRNSHCLLIPPDHKKMYKLKLCGNRIVEDGEQCDCGSDSQCKLDLCCQSNCMLRPGAACAIGLCCTNCQYLPARSVCRKTIGICDLPEYCNGTSETCPEDVYVQDGTPCDEGAYCYHGSCTTHNGQCKMIFGSKAEVASDNCFRVMNARHDRFGNCGLKHGTYTMCNAKDILCGRIQCEDVEIIPDLEDHSTIIQTQIGHHQCWGTDYHSGMEIADIGAVKDGTSCGTDMMCISGHCVKASLLMYDCNVTKCNNRGVCNTHRHCHCDYGWAPPDCLYEGYGGSIDSGPASEDRSGIFIGTIAGVLIFLIAAVMGISFAVFCKSILRNHLRRSSSSISPEESSETV
ncbi:hypothetical protein JRQ81_000708 [Phrynocephalus forsythii]|uniref:Disintegrin and metalloproteinase domain-containing protein 20-like n=1 Tax=Phrynocephalus forsythii TaxID=171643 RepID=A0A9Q0Y9Z0_9SAUR|nr:hypothetical protein JRQ81_000708 [Phrynocephalus forsythii]